MTELYTGNFRPIRDDCAVTQISIINPSTSVKWTHLLRGGGGWEKPSPPCKPWSNSLEHKIKRFNELKQSVPNNKSWLMPANVFVSQVLKNLSPTCLLPWIWPITPCFLCLSSSRLQLSRAALYLNYTHTPVSQRVDKHVISQIRNPFATSCKHFPHRQNGIKSSTRANCPFFFPDA